MQSTTEPLPTDGKWPKPTTIVHTELLRLSCNLIAETYPSDLSSQKYTP